MSDFFGDDFTAELKGYYLTSLNAELEKFADLLDDSTLKRVRAEIREQCQNWIVDAKSNEFEYLSAWFQGFLDKLDVFATPEDLVQALRTAKKYVDNLQETKKDSPEYGVQFALTAELQGESLYLRCKVAGQEFVVPIKYVVEISGALPLYPLPEKREGLLGVIPFRGDALPVVSLQDYGFQKNEKTQFLYVICEFEGTRFSLQVAETDELMSVCDKDLQSIESSSVIISVPFIRNFFIKDQRSVMVLDIERLVAA
ncbi:chemotaxis protein CheW [Bdellovibrio svalbardensis]|uniref:Chemotaxis protein CheW n=1 Tax=Bdellovibrio svalbardensis TaxID=2972972 RepID=A0ABT6DM37_9BACT|nr:chemotaxis protein CheW [Bdellovibrio svalbardensis]MDG0816979.1 chemotaxis protein CheW [Bdellovibrio svalbardensis]